MILADCQEKNFYYNQSGMKAIIKSAL